MIFSKEIENQRNLDPSLYMFHDVDLIELSTVVFLQRKGHLC